MKKTTEWCVCGNKKLIGSDCEECEKNKHDFCINCNKIKERNLERYCSNDCRKTYEYKNAMEQGAPLLEWLREDFTKLPEDTDLGRLFENPFTDWLGIPFWFKLDEMSGSSGHSIDEIKSILIEAGKTDDVLRMANSDLWVLRHPIMCEIMHAHLRVILCKFL